MNTVSMLSGRTLCVLCALCALCVPIPGAEGEVTVTTKAMTFTGQFQPKRENSHYPDKAKPVEEKDVTVDVIVLDNGIVEAWVVPAWGARLLRAIDKETGADYFLWNDQVQFKLAWSWPGGVKPSFPFFEHGTHMAEPAGHCIVKHPDGAVTVAMDLRFSRYNDAADMARYGHYGDEALNVMVTVRPGSSVVEWHQRKENHNPLPRGDRLWNDALYPARQIMKDGEVKQRNPAWKKDSPKDVPKYLMVPGKVPDREAMVQANRYLYPMDWVMDHGPNVLHTSPHWSNLDNWCVSHFALLPRIGFCGIYDVPDRINRLRIFDADPVKGDACKLYSCAGPFCELWGGMGTVFEKPGDLRPAYEPVEFRHRFWLAQGIGEATIANDHVAVAVDGTAFELVASRACELTAGDAAGPAGPHTILKGSFDGKRLVVKEGETPLLDQTFPLGRPTPAKDAQPPERIAAAFAKVKGPDPEFDEKDCLAVNNGIKATNLRVLEAARKVTAETDPVRALSLMRACYRWGWFDEALKIAELFPGPDADLVKGLIAWEKGEVVDFGKADWRAGYHRALQAIQKATQVAGVEASRQYTAEALDHLGTYLAEVPDAFRPRLAKAFWAKDRELAAACIAENPGSPEAQAVGMLLGVDGSRDALDPLLLGGPEATDAVADFLKELKSGTWKHVRRYEYQPEGAKQ